MTYSEKTLEIVSRSIKSAVFIDEKARNVYDYEALDNDSLEERLSIEIFRNFKQNGISLAVHKFNNQDMNDQNLLSYLFDDRDLVLLDWKLNGDSGEEYSLKLLSRVVHSNHINFCCIYTTEPNNDNIFLNIMSFFSGITLDDFNRIKHKFEDEFEELISSIKNTYNFLDYNSRTNGSHIGSLIRDGLNFEDLINLCGGGVDKKEALFLLMLSFERYHKSETPNKKPTLISFDNQYIVINNTIICIINKEDALSHEPIRIINNLSNKIENATNSFTQLLGIEMQNIFNSQGSFIDENLLCISKDALFAHRQYIKAHNNNNNDLPFKTLIKQLLLEHTQHKLRDAQLSLLNEEFLNNQENGIMNLSSDDISLINTFYNSVSIKEQLTNTPILNFGDIFKGEQDYYLCITALCDCLRPEKIKQNYYFVKGKKIDTETANSLGDSAFISYVGKDSAISWIALEPEKDIEINEIGKTEYEITIEKLQIENKRLNPHKHLPVYIKPYSFNVRNPQIIDSIIEIRRIISDEMLFDNIDNGNLEFEKIHYITTLRLNYAQRIANHAFAHPLRVGVDFVSTRI